jgi:hypothetical protein
MGTSKPTYGGVDWNNRALSCTLSHARQYPSTRKHGYKKMWEVKYRRNYRSLLPLIRGRGTVRLMQARA